MTSFLKVWALKSGLLMGGETEAWKEQCIQRLTAKEKTWSVPWNRMY